MLNKLKAFLGSYQMVQSGESVVCAVSGGADSMALLWAMYLLRQELGICLWAAHFNHHLRAGESDRDETFVKKFCDDYGIPLILGGGQVVSGEKGLEAAAREARYGFLRGLPGKIATAHTADDNAETVLMHLVRGTGLRGLGGIAPVDGQVIRPMLNVTRQEVMAFLEEYGIPHVEDSSNSGDGFLRNRLRHHVMPLLGQENPSLGRNLSKMALRLREDEAVLDTLALQERTDRVSQLRVMEPGIRGRVLARMLADAGVKEPEAEHIRGLEKLVFSTNPSARASFSGGVTFVREYDRLLVGQPEATLETRQLPCPGSVCVEQAGVRIRCEGYTTGENTVNSFSVCPRGTVVVRSRQTGDTIRLAGGTKSLKKLFIDRKIPASRRNTVPVIADEDGVLAVVGFGGNLDRMAGRPEAVRIQIEYL